jgi:SH3-like domain-containing protein
MPGFLRGTAVRRTAALALVLAAAAAQAADVEKKPPYWASISATKALMRTGPGRNYPATWLYVRPDLPVKVLETYPNWRKVQDPDGATGWMLQRLLSDTRTGLVTGSEPQPLHESADEHSAVTFRAEPGVVGRLSRCGGGWCLFDAKGRRGYIRVEHLWGLDASGTLG